MTRPLSFEQAKAQFVHRFTMDHVPAWAQQPAPNGQFYAPQFRSDREWYDKAKFHGESELATRNYCFSSGQSWPLGTWLDAPFRRIAA
ncbi:hypothetical protein [Mesorhizobium sp. WSM2239]|uniref:Uncharacterized protein n=2 Tax=unclassified Mesorhizobium TaxID=325217 RepID=A0AAU8DE88_9HYPH